MSFTISGLPKVCCVHLLHFLFEDLLIAKGCVMKGLKKYFQKSFRELQVCVYVLNCACPVLTGCGMNFHKRCTYRIPDNCERVCMV